MAIMNKLPQRHLYYQEGDRCHLDMHPGQLRTWNSLRRFVFMLAGTQGGKTSFGPWWLYREIYDKAVGKGPGDYLAVTSSFDLFKLKMLPEMRTVFERLLKVGRYWAGDMVIELRDPSSGKFWAKQASDPMWGRIVLRSAASEGGLESSTAKAAWLDEVGQEGFRLEAWEAILRRLSIHQGRLLATTTLYSVGWLKQQVYDRWLSGDPNFDIIQFTSILNPLFPREEYERAEQTLPTWKFRMFYKGEFDRPPGLIYSDYDESIHLVHKPFIIPPQWPRYVGLDPGSVNEWGVWVAEDPSTHTYFIYRETELGYLTSSEKAEKLLALAKGENVVKWVGGNLSEHQYRRDLQDNGVYVEAPPFGEVEIGIDRIISLFRQKRLFVFDLPGLRDELGTYSRKLDQQGQITQEIRDKNAYHRLDSLRYAATALDTAFGWADLSETEDTQPDNLWSILRPGSEFYG